MTLIVKNAYVTKKSISYLKRRIAGYLVSILNTKKLLKYDEYFNSNPLNDFGGVKISCKIAIILGITNLSHTRFETETHIFINPNIMYPGTTFKVVDLCRIINFGTIDVEGYPIFTQTFNHFSKHIKKYINDCTYRLG